MNSEVVGAAVDCQGLALKHAADELQSDPGLALRAVAQDASAMEYVAEALKDDRNFVLEAS